MTSLTRQYITDQQMLSRLCHELPRAERIGLDTEFVGETSFLPKLELVQVATDRLFAAIDMQAITSLQPLGEALSNPSTLKIFHAGRQDLELFRTHAGLEPTPIFDTQVAAAMVGYGQQVGYAQLVQRLLGKEVAKAHTLTNWSERPLSEEQVAYALADVEFLLPLHEHLHERLVALGRLDWVNEEFDRLISEPNEVLRDPRRRYERIRGWERLSPQSAAILRELAEWREGEAHRRNVPRGRIVRDEILVELARRKPTDINHLRATRGLSQSLVDRQGDELLSLIRKGAAMPRSECPQAPCAPKPDPDTAGRLELLQAVLKAYAKDAAIAPTLLATTADLHALIDAKDDRARMDLPLMKGWRRGLVGDTLLGILHGRNVVRLDPKSHRLLVSGDEARRPAVK